MADISDDMLARLLERAEQKGRQAAQTQPMYAQQPMYIMQQPTTSNRQSNFGFVIILAALALIGWWIASNLAFDKPTTTVRSIPTIARAVPSVILPTIAPSPAPILIIAAATLAPVVEVAPTWTPIVIVQSPTPQPTWTPTEQVIRCLSAPACSDARPTATNAPVLPPTDVVACIGGIEYRNGIQVATPVAVATGSASGGCW